MNKPIIAITIGDANGIGPEVTLKALAQKPLRDTCRAVIVAPISVVHQTLPRIDVALKLQEWSEFGNSFPADDEIAALTFETGADFRVEPGRVTAAAGKVAARSLEIALELALAKKVDAVVTAPISKKSLNLAGYHYPGHTEFLAEMTQAADVVMVLLSGNFRVGLATTHCALAEIPALLSQDKIVRKLKILSEDLRRRFKIANPKIAVAALNPHAGEDGMFGNEEIEIIGPAIAQAQALGVEAAGPFPADTLFARVDERPFDAYFAMYHDQGLIPLKMKSFGRAVNYTAGLPIIRTSPDHGTAFDIAGKGAADPGSMVEAITLAIKLAAHSQTG